MIRVEERRLRIVQRVRLFSFLPLIGLAVLVSVTLPQSGLAPVFALLAIVSTLGLRIAERVLTWRMHHLHYVEAGRSRWWVDRRTGAAEEGEHARGPFRDGPYPSQEAAERAPEIARQRAAEWNAED
jgi:hypothetical protein